MERTNKRKTERNCKNTADCKEKKAPRVPQNDNKKREIIEKELKKIGILHFLKNLVFFPSVSLSSFVDSRLIEFN